MGNIEHNHKSPVSLRLKRSAELLFGSWFFRAEQEFSRTIQTR